MTVPTTIQEEWEADETLRRANTPLRVLILEDAADLTGAGGERHKDYGDPVENHAHIARIFNAVTDRDLTAREVAIMLGCVKWARRAKSPLHRDSYVDGTAYAGIEYECALAEEAGRGIPKTL
jgi:hypothetical protein